MYSLEYLPVAQQDMVEIVQYISGVLGNSGAAEQLAFELIQAGDQIVQFPYAHPAYIPIRPLKHEYRKLLIKNYMMLYWVDENRKKVTVARVLYAKRDIKRYLE